MSLKNDIILIQHMLDAANEAVEHCAKISKNDFLTNRPYQALLIRSLEVIGEASSRVSPECKAGHPEVPWRIMIAMRNRLIHAYFDINVSLIWETCVDDLPALIEQLESMKEA
jgi:uncharacterized protein with HEPN domain